MLQDPLSALRDIHLPPHVEFWPPAPGWWVLAAILLALLVFALFRAWKHWKSYAPRRSAIRELAHITEDWRQTGNSSLALRKISTLLRRLAVAADPSAASLTGTAWLQHLDSQTGGNRFMKGPAQVLAEGPYQSSCKETLEPVLDAVHAWIRRWKNLPASKPSEAKGTRGRNLVSAVTSSRDFFKNMSPTPVVSEQGKDAA